MRGAVFLGERQIELMEFPDPKPSPNEVIVEMRASGLCGSDFRRYRELRNDRKDLSQLNAGGHEPCGQVTEIGSGVRHLREDDNVIVHHYLGCGKCK